MCVCVCVCVCVCAHFLRRVMDHILHQCGTGGPLSVHCQIRPMYIPTTPSPPSSDTKGGGGRILDTEHTTKTFRDKRGPAAPLLLRRVTRVRLGMHIYIYIYISDVTPDQEGAVVTCCSVSQLPWRWSTGQYRRHRTQFLPPPSPGHST